MEACIYKFTNIINNKIYIGQTKNIISRLHSHLRHQKNYTFNEDLIKYGWKSFKFEILEFVELCSDINIVLNNKEQYYINIHKEQLDFNTMFYNVIENIHNPTFSRSKETIQNMSNSKKGCKCSQEHIENNKQSSKKRFKNSNPFQNLDRQSIEYRKKVSIGIRKTVKNILQYDLEGNFITRYETQIDAAKAIGIEKSYNINKCLKGISEQAYNYQWKYYSDNFPIKINSINRKIKVLDSNKVFIGIFNNPMDAAIAAKTYPNRVYYALNQSKHNFSANHYFYEL